MKSVFHLDLVPSGSVICAAIITITVSLTACSKVEDFVRPKDPPRLEGKRIPILTHNRSLTADKNLNSQPILLPAPTPNTSWPQAGGYANHAMHHIEVNDILKPAWSVEIGTGSDDEERLNAQPVIAAGMVFTMDARTQVRAFNEASGQLIWSAELEPDDDDDSHIGGGLAFEDGHLFVTTGFAEVIALEAKTGKVIWRQNLTAPMRTAPTVRNGRLFAVTLNNQIFALNVKDGSIIWRHRGLPEVASVLGGASPAVGKGVAIVAYTSGELIAFKVENGRILWQDVLAANNRPGTLSSLSGIRGRPIIDRDRVFAISNAGVLVSIDLRTGRRVWDKEVIGIESPWIAGNYLYLLTTQSEIAALSRVDGKVYWVRGLPRHEDPEDRKKPIIWTGPILASDRLIVAGSNQEALAISPYTGRILGVIHMPDAVTVAPVVANGSVYFLADDAELVTYR